MCTCLTPHPSAVVLSCAAELKKQLLSQRLVNSSDILGGTHCLAPACIRASLASSLAKLRVETLDLLYLHNPAEVQLEARGKAGFFEVLRAAFKVGTGGSAATIAIFEEGRDLCRNHWFEGSFEWLQLQRITVCGTPGPDAQPHRRWRPVPSRSLCIKPCQ